MTGELHYADRLLALTLGWQFRRDSHESLFHGKIAEYLTHRRPHFPEEGDYSWVPWDPGERFTQSMDACDPLLGLMERRELRCVMEVGGQVVARILRRDSSAEVSRAIKTTMAEAFSVALVRALMRLGDIPVAHEPHRTPDGAPAHGCEACDGEDWCSCSETERYAYCEGCGGRWPKCAEAVE